MSDGKVILGIIAVVAGIVFAISAQRQAEHFGEQSRSGTFGRVLVLIAACLVLYALILRLQDR